MQKRLTTSKMTSQNILQPINCNIREPDGEPINKRPRREFGYTSKNEINQRWSLSSGQNELDILAEMGLAMLDSDNTSDCKSEDDSCRPSSSSASFEPNDTNPDLIVPGDYYSSNHLSDDSVDSAHNAIRKSIDSRNELQRQSKTWEDFCIYRRPSMLNQDTKDWFNCLSDEIILMIFRWLPKKFLVRCALVCKRWHRLTSDETLWTRLDCTAKALEEGALGNILSRQVIILKLTQAEISDPPILHGVKAFHENFVSKLMYLDLSMATVSCKCLEVLLEKCYRLRKLSLESCKINEDVCKQLTHSENIEILNLTMVEGLNAKGIEYIMESCRQLKELNLAWTSLTIDALDLLCVSLPSCLIRLNIAGCRKTLNVNHVKKLVIASPNLKELDLSDGTSLTNETIKYIMQLNELNFLALSRCYNIQCTMLKKLGKMQLLQYLDIHGGHIEQNEINDLQQVLGSKIHINKFLFSSIARPTVGMKRSSIWGLREYLLTELLNNKEMFFHYYNKSLDSIIFNKFGSGHNNLKRKNTYCCVKLNPNY